ncbi:MAG: bacillithiol biosynthesis deacetylase BshB1 [Candidatus Eisenbacteria bacterium]
MREAARGVDLLVVGAHPDDLELHFGGIAAKAAQDGLVVVGLDLTRGERASRGAPEVRAAEAVAAARALGLVERLNAGLPDTGVTSTDPAHLVAVVEIVRRVRPRWVLAPHPEDPHPDHREGGRLLERALYFAHVGGFAAEGARHRARGLLHDWPEAGGRAAGFAAHGAGIVVDVSASFAAKRAALECYQSQFAAGAGEGTRLNRPGFLDAIAAKARRLGELVGATYGEGLVHAGALAWSGSLAGLFGEGGFRGGPTA